MKNGKKIILISIIIVVVLGILFFYLNNIKERTDKIEKEISNLKTTQNEQEKRVNTLVTFNWKKYFNKNWISFEYPEFASLCEEETNEGLDIKVSFYSDCEELKKNTTRSSLWDFEIRYIRKDLGSTEDVLSYVDLRGAKNISDKETKNKFPGIGEDYLTEWYLKEKNDTYAVIKFNPTLKLKSPNLALVIMARDYEEFSLKNKSIVDLILKSIQLP